VKNSGIPFFKSATFAILSSFFFGCLQPIFSKSNDREILAVSLNPESDIRGYRVPITIPAGETRFRSGNIDLDPIMHQEARPT
jgi:hypothetical protein